MADPPGPDSSLRPPSSPMGDDHDTCSDRVEQEPGGASVIPGCDQPDPPRPEIETDTGVRARPDIDGDDSSTSTYFDCFDSFSGWYGTVVFTSGI